MSSLDLAVLLRRIRCVGFQQAAFVVGHSGHLLADEFSGAVKVKYLWLHAAREGDDRSDPVANSVRGLVSGVQEEGPLKTAPLIDAVQCVVHIVPTARLVVDQIPMNLGQESGHSRERGSRDLLGHLAQYTGLTEVFSGLLGVDHNACLLACL